MLTIRLLGAGQASYLGQPLIGFPAQQPYLLLCYLLLFRHHPHSRERLAAVFWGDCTTAMSRKCLRNALWRLRHELQLAGAPVDTYIAADGEYVSFLGASPYWLDIEAFESPAASFRGLAGHALQPEQAQALQDADALYAGDLLEGVYEDWCLQERERLRLLHINTLNKLMDYHTMHKVYEAGLACGNAILALDSTREGVHQRMMHLYWLSGDRCAALGQYHRCTQILREELGVAPMEQTRRMYEQMKTGRYPPVDRPPIADASRFAFDGAGDATQSRVSYALEKLRRLEAMVRELSLELAAIEDLVSSGVPELRSA
jgi:DNA-binding SARP family transcriptional activator